MPAAGRRAEGQLDHARLELALLHIGEPIQQIEHPGIVGEDPGAEAPDAARLRGREQVSEERGADPLALPPVQYHEGHFRRVGAVGRLVAGHRNQLRCLARPALDDQGEPSPIVDLGEEPRPVRRQAPHHAKNRW